VKARTKIFLKSEKKFVQKNCLSCIFLHRNKSEWKDPCAKERKKVIGIPKASFASCTYRTAAAACEGREEIPPNQGDQIGRIFAHWALTLGIIFEN
jgi:hypothetical protein